MASNGGPSTSTRKTSTARNTSKSKISAGIVFTDGRTILGGYEPHKGCISGFGGKHENTEDPASTAIRETIEELYGIRGVKQSMIDDIKKLLRFDLSHLSAKAAYIFYVVDYDDLDKLLRYMSTQDIRSAHYPILPKNLTDLLNRRRIPGSEVESLELIPLASYEKIYTMWKKNRPKVITTPKKIPICPFFISDMKWVFNYFRTARP
jgi:8-oxo-dGTP pyrophosphatase MutT (NUDIX family)